MIRDFSLPRVQRDGTDAALRARRRFVVDVVNVYVRQWQTAVIFVVEWK